MSAASGCRLPIARGLRTWYLALRDQPWTSPAAGSHCARRRHPVRAVQPPCLRGDAAAIRGPGGRTAGSGDPAGPGGTPHRGYLACPGGGSRRRLGLPVPRRRPVRATGGTPLRPGTAAVRPLRQGVHRRTPRAPAVSRVARGGTALRGGRRRLRLGRRPPPGTPAAAQPHLRTTRAWLYRSPQRWSRPPRHLSWSLRTYPAPAGVGGHRGRTTAGAGVRRVRRRRGGAGRSAAGQLLGLQSHRPVRTEAALQRRGHRRRPGGRVQGHGARTARGRDRGDPGHGIQPFPRG